MSDGEAGASANTVTGLGSGKWVDADIHGWLAVVDETVDTGLGDTTASVGAATGVVEIVADFGVITARLVLAGFSAGCSPNMSF